MSMSVSVLVASYQRPERLAACLRGLAEQSHKPLEVLVVWQADDRATLEQVRAQAAELPIEIRALHCPEAGVVPAENLALSQARGELIAMIDDDAVPPADWLERLSGHFRDPSVGMAGGPFDNFDASGQPFERRDREPIGRVTWYGKVIGNVYDHPASWRQRPPQDVHHLAGSNIMFRRGLVQQFETGLRKYWQSFELEAAFQVRRRGYRILFDFGCVVRHYPSSTAHTPDRAGELEHRVFNPAHNLAFVLAKHSPWFLRWVRLGFLLGVGSTQLPGLLGAVRAWRRYGNLRREAAILLRCWQSTLTGWRAGRRAGRCAEGRAASGFHKTIAI